MRILVVGAGAIGGYFGARLLEGGRDVTFLVRPRRAAELARSGLIVTSRFGDVNVAGPATVTADALSQSFDLILLSCKAYDLAGAIDSITPAVGENTAILPLLNGMAHVDRLIERFGAARVLGGLCMTSTTLDAEGRVNHLNDLHFLSFGERDGTLSPRIEAINAELSGLKFDATLSQTIMQEMWEKWVFIATAAGINCLMRSSVGDIVAAGAADLALKLLNECAAIATIQTYAPREAAMTRNRTIFTTGGSPLIASMLRDVERGAPTEADHVLGDLLRRAEDESAAPMLRIAYAHLKAYAVRRQREAAAS